MTTADDMIRQTANDLAWLVNSPSLLINHLSVPFKVAENLIDCFGRLSENTNINYRHLVKNAAPNFKAPPRVGRYLEALLQFWFTTHEQTKVLASQIQIFDRNQTIGELDYLLESEHITVHVEAAVKYYLKIRKGESWLDFVGPNINDNLDNKISKLAQKQLTLCHNPITREQLGLDLQKNVTPIALTKGFLFYPRPEFANEEFEVLPGVNPKHLRGWWETFASLRESAPEFSHRYAIVPKPHWLSFSPTLATQSLPLSDLLDHIQSWWTEREVPLLIAEFDRNGSKTEKSRGFVVPDTWPEMAVSGVH
ncbi:MAG: DUF1853 family protein [Myxococcota bacterium]|nr:DUF1853 family protein [Myxococcota bacterium]